MPFYSLSINSFGILKKSKNAPSYLIRVQIIIQIMGRRRRVSFRATKYVKKPVRVKFTNWEGEKVSFKAHKSVPKRVTISFLAKKKKRR